MSDFEKCNADHTLSAGYQHGDEPQCNRSGNRSFQDVIEARMQRRGFMIGGLSAIAGGFIGASLGASPALAKDGSKLLGFRPVPVSNNDTVVVPEGYSFQVLGPAGEPITGSMPPYRFGADSGADQAMQLGQHHDGMHFFPIDGSSQDGLIAVNHEYLEARLLHATSWQGQAVGAYSFLQGEDGLRDDDEVLKEINAHGISVYRTSKQADGKWAIVQDPRNRRVTARTPVAIGGPMRGSHHMVTRYSPDGTMTRGTINNCSHGVTPWNTYLTAEENWAAYFINSDGEDDASALPREQARYGVPTRLRASRYGWHLARSGGDDFVRFNASAIGASARDDYRNEPNCFGWIVEVDPFDPDSTPVKRTSLGRFAHEGVVFAPAEAGKPVVCYSGDDAQFEYIYKFVSEQPFVPGETDGSILDSGTLYVARFDDDGTGEWLALAPGQNGLTPENGFADLTDILVNTRLAADIAGATKMDRPEWGAVNAQTGDTYFTLTNNSRRTPEQVDAANPRAQNHFGQIIRWRYSDRDPVQTGFTWDLFVVAGDQDNSAVFTGEALDDSNIFACPDGLWFDKDGRLWIQTDMADKGPDYTGPLKQFGMNMMLAADPSTGEIRRFMTGPWGQEITGVVTTPDGRTMFMNVQHPGAHASAEDFAAGNYGSGFPAYDGSIPRSATLVITKDDGGVIGS